MIGPGARRMRLRGSAERPAASPRVRRRGLAMWVLVVGGVLVACGGSGGEPAAAPFAAVAIDPAPASPPADPTSSATATPPVAATVTPTPSPPPTQVAPTPTVERTPEEEAVLAAWERYLDLSIDARGKAPPAEALEFETYAAPDAETGIRNAMESENYAVGRVLSTSFGYFITDAGDARVSDCLDVDLEFRAKEDASFSSDEIALVPAEARLEWTSEHGWRVAAFQSGQGTACD